MTQPSEKPPVRSATSPIDPIEQESEQLCLMFTSSELRVGAVGRGADSLMCLSDSHDTTQRYAHGVSLSFRGYENGSLPIPMVTEVRCYLQALHAHWPYWLHFLRPDPLEWSVLLLSLMKSTRYVGLFNNEGKAFRFDVKELDALIADMSYATINLHECLKYDDERGQTILNQSIMAIDKCMRKG